MIDSATPAAWRYVPSDTWAEPVITPDPRLAQLAREFGRKVEPLYTAEQLRREPLSQDTVLDFADGCTLQFHDLLAFARKVERAHGIGA